MTLHMPQRAGVMDQLLSAVEASLLDAGALRVWIDPASTHDLTVMAELPEQAEGEVVTVPEPRAGENVVTAE
jgi:hypothetical protein